MGWVLAHFVGDYLLQTDWMGLNKKQSSWACLAHIVTYMIPFLFVGLLPWQLLAIAVQHYAQDRSHFVEWFMKKTRPKFYAEPFYPWSHVVVDNTLHFVWMAAMIYWVPRWLG